MLEKIRTRTLLLSSAFAAAVAVVLLWPSRATKPAAQAVTPPTGNSPSAAVVESSPLNVAWDDFSLTPGSFPGKVSQDFINRHNTTPEGMLLLRAMHKNWPFSEQDIDDAIAQAPTLIGIFSEQLYSGSLYEEFKFPAGFKDNPLEILQIYAGSIVQTGWLVEESKDGRQVASKLVLDKNEPEKIFRVVVDTGADPNFHRVFVSSFHPIWLKDYFDNWARGEGLSTAQENIYLSDDSLRETANHVVFRPDQNHVHFYWPDDYDRGEKPTELIVSLDGRATFMKFESPSGRDETLTERKGIVYYDQRGSETSTRNIPPYFQQYLDMFHPP